ncbi:MAG: zf-HC2 domain-containing protein [Actinomycetota bacterium]
MSWQHERVEELLAGHALGGLDPEDASLAERALEEHVPECESCRRAWDGYREVAADLALAAPAIQPPETLDSRVRRAMRRPRGIRPLTAAATAAAAVMVAFSGFNMIRAGQLGDQLEAAEVTQNSLFDVVSTVAHPEHETIPLTGAGDTEVALYYQPGEERGYLMARGLPEPRHQYHVWFLADGQVWHAGVLKVESGRAVFPCRTDPTKWDAVMLTDQAGRPEPTSSPLVSATFAAPAA